MDYKKLIPNRKSVRDYKKTQVKQQLLDELKDFCETGRKLIPGIGIDVIMKNKDEVYELLKGVAGYKGSMLEAPHYVIILSDKRDYYVENVGYIGENLMLKAFELGIGSCWITFEDGSAIKNKLQLNSDKEITALIALGYDDNKTKIINPVKTGGNYSKTDMQIVTDNTSYRHGVEQIVFINEWDNNADADNLDNRGLLNGFHYARLAPSTLNRQPWRFIVDDGIIVLVMRIDDHINKYEEKIDIGIIMLYFEVIIDTTLFDLKWKLGKPEKEYKIPEDYTIVGYCMI